MPETVVNIVNHSDWLPAIYAAEAMLSLPKYLTMTPRMSQMFTDKLSARGQKVIVPVTGTLTLSVIGEDTKLAVSKPTGNSTVEVVMNRQVAVAFGTQQAFDQMAGPTFRQSYTKEALMLIAQDMEASAAALYSAMTLTGGDAGVDLDGDALPDVIQALKDANCPAGYFDVEGGVSLFMSTKDGNSFRRDPDLTDQAALGGSGPGPRITGRIARYMGIDLYESQAIVSSGGARHNMVVPSDAWAIVSAPMEGPGDGKGVKSEYVSMPLGNNGEGEAQGLVFRVDEQWDYTLQSNVIVVTVLYGVKVIRPAICMHLSS